MTTRVNFTIHERLPYCDCDLCKCNHGFNLDIAKKSEVVGKPATVYMSLKKWEFPFLPKLNFTIHRAILLQGYTRSKSGHSLGMEGLPPDIQRQTGTPTDIRRQTDTPPDTQRQTDIPPDTQRQTYRLEDIHRQTDRPTELCLKRRRGQWVNASSQQWLTSWNLGNFHNTGVVNVYIFIIECQSV